LTVFSPHQVNRALIFGIADDLQPLVIVDGPRRIDVMPQQHLLHHDITWDLLQSSFARRSDPVATRPCLELSGYAPNDEQRPAFPSVRGHIFDKLIKLPRQLRPMRWMNIQRVEIHLLSHMVSIFPFSASAAKGVAGRYRALGPSFQTSKRVLGRFSGEQLNQTIGDTIITLALKRGFSAAGRANIGFQSIADHPSGRSTNVTGLNTFPLLPRIALEMRG
jgi:hypothetical protein